MLGAAGSVLYDVAGLARLGTAVRGAVGVFVGLAIVTVGLGYLSRGRAVDVARSLPLVGDLSSDSPRRRRQSRPVGRRPGDGRTGRDARLAPLSAALPGVLSRSRPARVHRRALAGRAWPRDVSAVFAYGPPLARCRRATARHCTGHLVSFSRARARPAVERAGGGYGYPESTAPTPGT